MDALDETAIRQESSACGIQQQKSLADAIEIIQNTRAPAQRLEVDVTGVHSPAGEHDLDRRRRADLPFIGRHRVATLQLTNPILCDEEQLTLVGEHREE